MLNGTVDCKKVWPPTYLSLLTVFIAATFCLVITMGNLMVVIAVIMNPLKKLRSPFNYFVINLAVADLIVGIISMPIGIYLHILEYLMQISDFLAVKKIFQLALFISLTASLLCLISLSIDRYIAITFPLKYRSNLSWKKCWIVSFVIWLFSLTLPMVYLKVGYIDFLMIYINTAVVIAAITLMITYIRVHKFLRAQAVTMKTITRTTSTHEKILEAKRTSEQQRVTRVLLWILILFLACYIPGTVCVYILQFCVKCNCEFIHIMRDTSFYLLTVNSCMNPFVYAFKNKHYRHTVVELCKRSRRKVSTLVSITSFQRSTASSVGDNIDTSNK